MLVLCCVASNLAQAQIFVTNPSAKNISEYNLDTGAVITDSLIPDLDSLLFKVTPSSIIAVNGSLFFQTTDSFYNHSSVAKYTLSNSSFNSAFVNFPADAGGSIASSGSGVYVHSTIGGDHIVEYDANTGNTLKSITQHDLSPLLAASSDYFFEAHSGTGIASSGTTYAGVISGFSTINGTAVSTFNLMGVGNVTSMVVSGSHLFIAGTITPAGTPSTVAGVVGVAEYDALTGQLLDASFIEGLSNPIALAVLENSLYILDSGKGTIGEYSLTNGEAINPTLVTGLTDASSLAVVPEPQSAVLCATGIVIVLAGAGKLRRKQPLFE